MYLIPEDLKKYGACEQAIKYIKRFHPNGDELVDIIKDRHIPKDYLHWGKEHLSINEQELQAYCEVCHIENSKNFWKSVKIYESENVINCKQVHNSFNIYGSQDIKSSSNIANSSMVGDSNLVFLSNFVDQSQQIVKSKNVVSCKNICDSEAIYNSKNVINSSNVFDSSEIIHSENVTGSVFCSGCSNIKNSLFCWQESNLEYAIFNQQVDEKRFQLFMEQYKKYLNEELVFVKKWPKELAYNEEVQIQGDFSKWYVNISDIFWQWVRTLPNFDSTLMYKITMQKFFIT